MADEAANSRLLGGIHFRHDNEDGLALGRQVARLVIARRDVETEGVPALSLISSLPRKTPALARSPEGEMPTSQHHKNSEDRQAMETTTDAR